jgi:cytosine/adenosine deaminase-related metal-dependent hydrolase
MDQDIIQPIVCDLLLRGTIVTMDDNNTVIENGAVAVSGDSIMDIGSAVDLAKKYQFKETIELSRGVVMPGLINAHAKVMSPEESMGSDEDVYHDVFPAIAQMIRTGTTSFCDVLLSSEDILRGVKKTGIRHWTKEVLSSDSTSSFTQLESAFRKQKGEMVHCPCNNMNYASGLTPIPEVLSSNVKIGLGTGTDSMHDYDLFAVMDINSKLHKVHALDSTVMTARQTLYMATRGGAEVLGVDHLIGSVEVGKKADLIVLDFDQPHLTPVYDIPSHLVYAARGSDVVHSMINGRIVMRDRQLTSFDTAEIAYKIRL